MPGLSIPACRFARRVAALPGLAMTVATGFFYGAGLVSAGEPELDAAYFQVRPERNDGALTFGLPVQPPRPPPGQSQHVAPPGRIGTPVAANVPLQQWKTQGPPEEFGGATPSMELDSRLIFALFDSPDAFFFDNLQFLNRVRVGLEAPGFGVLQADVLDRWNLARELLARDVPGHLPEIHRLFWQWTAPGGGFSGTFGRQRLAGPGNRGLGSVSWLPDLQVFDGARFDIGRPQDGRLTLGAFIDHALDNPSFAGPSGADEVLLLAALEWKSPGAGTFQPFAMTAPEDGAPPVFGFHWQQAPNRDPRAAAHHLEFHYRPPGVDEMPAWHAAIHRRERDWTWHLGFERVDDGSQGRRISATPGTFRYLPGGPDSDALNLFLGFDRRLGSETLASLTAQQIFDEATGAPSGEVLEAAIRHQISPTAAFLAGAGCGMEDSSGEVFPRTGFQITAAF